MEPLFNAGKELREVEYITLNNGVEMPILGYGTYQTPSRITEQCVADALRFCSLPVA